MDKNETGKKSRQEMIREARESFGHSPTAGNPPLYSKEKWKTEDSVQEPAVKKGTLIRLTIACILFLAVFAWKQSEIKLGSYDTAFVKTCLASNELADQLENQVAGFVRDKIMPVFNPSSADQ